ncbi:MAG TPA: hypothetical protein P5243_10420 [Bacteroidales bacterium]|jgi:hypothetical protein|nr:hypothetical protein [Bacteroidales bacterium]HRS19910.1 hypothetical protein [Bacteroidales bacterium]
MKKLLCIAALFSAVYFTSCSGDVEPETSQKGFIIDTVGHFGYDFSAAKMDTSYWETNMNDGGVIGWHSGRGTHPQYPSSSHYVWFRNSEIDTVHYECQIKNYGTTDITKIHSINTNWDTIINPLIPGHVFGARCKDGYVLFEVVEVTDTLMWEAVLKFKFSPTNNF